jgi:hypothetical protein
MVFIQNYCGGYYLIIIGRALTKQLNRGHNYAEKNFSRRRRCKDS